MSQNGRTALLLAALLLCTVMPTVHAQEVELPAFRTFRWQEDYSVLARAHHRVGHATLKYLPLESGAWISFGGEVRERIEHHSKSAATFGRAQAETYALQRMLLHADIHSGSFTRLFVELGSFYAFGKDVDSPPAVDHFDVQQAFLDFRSQATWGTTTLRIGRHEMAFGSQRLIGLRDGPNVRRNYDGLRLTRTSGDKQLDLIAVRPVELRAGSFDNRTDDSLAFWGVYFTTPLKASSSSIDLYALGYERQKAVFASVVGDEHRRSFGARFFGQLGAWDWDIEPTVQIGGIADQRIFAWGVASDVGYRIQLGVFKVRAGVKVDYASGDDDPSDRRLGTANAMFPRLPYLGSAGAFAPSNIIDLHPSLAVSVSEGLTITLGHQFLWRASTADAVYVAPLNALPNTAGLMERFSAWQWPIDVSWRVNRHLQVDASFAWVQFAKRLKAVGAEDVGFAFISGAYRF